MGEGNGHGTVLIKRLDDCAYWWAIVWMKGGHYLEKVKNVNDSISQYTSYYLGKSYLTINNQPQFSIKNKINVEDKSN